MGELSFAGIKYETQGCITCGVLVVIPEAVINHLRAKGGFYYCVNGHTQGWNKSDSEGEGEKTRRERDRLKQQLAQKDDEIAAERRRIEELKAARKRVDTNHKKELERIHRREAAGTCPCCNRTVSQMARHMKTKHLEFVAEETANVVKMKAAK